MLDHFQYYYQVLCNGMKMRFRMFMIAHPGPGIRFHKRLMWRIIIPPTPVTGGPAYMLSPSLPLGSPIWTMGELVITKGPKSIGCVFDYVLIMNEESQLLSGSRSTSNTGTRSNMNPLTMVQQGMSLFIHMKNSMY